MCTTRILTALKVMQSDAPFLGCGVCACNCLCWVVHRGSPQMLSSKVNLGFILLVLEDPSSLRCSNDVPITSPPNTLFSPYPPISLLSLTSFILEKCHLFTCPYDSTRQPRQCARLMGGSRTHSKAISTMAITVKATGLIKKFSLQLGCKTSKSFPHDEQIPATLPNLQGLDSMPRPRCPPNFLPLCIRRSHPGMA